MGEFERFDGFEIGFFSGMVEDFELGFGLEERFGGDGEGAVAEKDDFKRLRHLQGKARGYF